MGSNLCFKELFGVTFDNFSGLLNQNFTLKKTMFKNALERLKAENIFVKDFFS